MPCGHRPLITNKSKLMVANASSAQRQALPDVLDNPSVVGQIKACPCRFLHLSVHCFLPLDGLIRGSMCHIAHT